MAWARGGYAVVSMQTTRAVALWTSPAGRSGDFPKVARDEFSTEALAKRMDCLAFVLQGLARRAAERKGFYTRMDSTPIAVAGFDLGAQTALALTGETHPGLPELPASPNLRAVIAISPLAILVRGGFAERFGTIQLPNLSITATQDTDPFGLVDSPYTWQAPFKLMQPGNKFLLVLEDGSHQTLSGGIPARPGVADQEGGMAGPPGGMGRGGTRDGARDEAMFRRFATKGLQRQIVIVEHVSLAFLHATVKADPVAREWLTRNAARWTDPLARLEVK